MTAQEIKGVDKLGNIYFPGDEKLPSFTHAHCSKNLDRILNEMPEKDRKDLELLMKIFSYLPNFLIALIVAMLEHMPGATPRFIRLGLRGLMMSLYYGNENILEKLNYHVSVYTKDMN